MKTCSAHDSNRDSTRLSIPVYCLLPILLGSACTSSIQPSSTVSETVIESILPATSPEKPWRLNITWREGGVGGSALRASSLEHVVSQAGQKFASTAVNSEANASANTGSQSFRITQIDEDPLMVERSWRKYCHHQLDMTPEEHALIVHTQIPHSVLNHGCNPGSLMK